ncbi:hypothetical protein Tco_1311744 [Tanacetum coccineum]
MTFRGRSPVSCAVSTLEGKSLALMVLEGGSTFFTPATQETPTDAKSMSDPEPLSYAEPQPHPEQDVAQSALHGKSGVREIDLRPIRGRVAKKYLPAEVGRDQQLPPGYPGRMPRHSRSHSATGAENLTLLEAEVDMKKAAEAKNVGLAKELESLHAQFVDLQVSNIQLSDQVSTLQTQVTGEERIKAAFEEFKKYEDDR